LNTEIGLNWSDYGFRYFDPRIGRWASADPLMELAPKITPYRYGFNNPILYTDPDGLFENRGEARRYRKNNKIKGKIKKNKYKGRFEIRFKNSDGRVYKNSDKEVEFAVMALSTGPSIRQDIPNIFEEIKNINFATSGVVDYFDNLWIVAQTINPFDKYTTRLTGGFTNNIENTNSLVNTLSSIVPAARGTKVVKTLVPKGGIFKRLNAAQFSKTFKGTALARAKPKIRSFINRYLNKSTDRINNITETGTFVIPAAKRLDQK